MTADQETHSLSASPAATIVSRTYSWRAVFFLLRLIVSRDILVNHRRTLLGAGWALLKPLATTAIFVLVFEKLMRVSGGNVPYPLFALTALLPWQVFADSVNRGSMSLLANRNIIEKSSAQRLVFPLAAVINATLNTLPGFLILGLLLGLYGIDWGVSLAALPLLFGLQILLAIGVVLALSSLIVFVRDLIPALPIGLQLLMLASPIAYPVEMVPPSLRSLYFLNPIALLTEAYRDTVLRGRFPSISTWAALATITALSLAIGALIFSRLNRRIPDVL